MLKIDRTILDEKIKELDGMFSATEKVLADYEAEKEALEQRGQHLSERMTELQNLHAETLLKREEMKDQPAKYISYSKALASHDEEMKIIASLQEQLKDDFKELKQKYIPLIRDSYGKDVSVKREFDVNQTVDYVRYELISAIADYAKKVREEDAKIMPLIYDEFLDNEQLMQENMAFRRQFDYERTRLSYSSMMPNVLTRNNVNLACGGSIDPEIRKPKGAE